MASQKRFALIDDVERCSQYCRDAQRIERDVLRSGGFEELFLGIAWRDFGVTPPLHACMA